MSAPPKRKFWQLHLSTAIFLVIMAGGILWIETTVVIGVSGLGGISTQWNADYGVGFPLPYYEREDLLVVIPPGEPDPIFPEKLLEKTFRQVFVRDASIQQQFSLLYFVIDLIFCFTVLLLLGAMLEWRIRRRETGKP